MLLAIDIGNTNITLGVFREETLLLTSRLATDNAKMPDQYAVDLMDIFRLNRFDCAAITGAIISSVVPSLDRTFRDAIHKLTGLTPLVVGPGTRTGMNIRIDNPAQLGADLLVGAVAAVRQYGAPCVIWDLGTATTVSVVDANGDFRGGAIMPGLITSYSSLSSLASLLPRIGVEAPDSVIGTNTTDCMRSGAVFGTAAMLDGVTQRIFDTLGITTPVIVTGGLGRDIAPHCRCLPIVDDDLLLNGLRLIYERNKK